jgi:hypothetical protein
MWAIIAAKGNASLSVGFANFHTNFDSCSGRFGGLKCLKVACKLSIKA